MSRHVSTGSILLMLLPRTSTESDPARLHLARAFLSCVSLYTSSGLSVTLMPHTSSRRRIPVAHRTKLTTSASSDGWSHIVRKGSSSTANPSTKFLPPTTSSGSSGYSNAELVELLTPAQLTHYCRLRSHEEKRHKANDMQVSEFTDERLGPQPQAPRYSEQELWKQFERVTGEWRSCGMEVRLRNVVESARVLELEEDVEEDNGRAGSDRHDVEHNQGAEGLANTLDQLSLRDKPAMISHKVICLGLGSPSADASGWRHIVLWQLVAFLAIADICMYKYYSFMNNILPSTDMQ